MMCLDCSSLVSPTGLRIIEKRSKSIELAWDSLGDHVSYLVGIAVYYHGQYIRPEYTHRTTQTRVSYQNDWFLSLVNAQKR